MNLFTAGLNQVELKLKDIEDFLGMNAPLEQRIPENIRIDYKVQPPSDYPETVASFANSYGGLLFLGIESSRTNFNFPTALTGADFPGGDIRASVAGKIVSQVVPRPEISIGVVPIPQQQDKAVVVIRVAPGVWPPYQFQLGDRLRIPIRIQDTDRQASLRDIEDLFRRRETLAKPSEKLLEAVEATSAQPPEFDKSAAGSGTPSPEPTRAFQIWTVVPRLPIHLQLDRAFESDARTAITRNFTDSGLGHFYRPRVAANFHIVGWQARITNEIYGILTYARIVKFMSDGSLVYAEKLDRHADKKESISDLFIESQRFFSFAADFYRSRDYFGPFAVSHVVKFLDLTRLYANFPDEKGNYHQTNVVGFGSNPGNALGSSRMFREINTLDKYETQRLLLDFMLAHLRELAQANIDYAALNDLIAKLPDVIAKLPARTVAPFF
jgi:hypothetical protein